MTSGAPSLAESVCSLWEPSLEPPPRHRGKTFGLNHSRVFLTMGVRGMVSPAAAGPERSAQTGGKQTAHDSGGAHHNCDGRWGVLLQLLAEAPDPKALTSVPPVHLQLDPGSQGCTADRGIILSHTPQSKPRAWTFKQPAGRLGSPPQKSCPPLSPGGEPRHKPR